MIRIFGFLSKYDVNLKILTKSVSEVLTSVFTHFRFLAINSFYSHSQRQKKFQIPRMTDSSVYKDTSFLVLSVQDSHGVQDLQSGSTTKIVLHCRICCDCFVYKGMKVDRSQWLPKGKNKGLLYLLIG